MFLIMSWFQFILVFCGNTQRSKRQNLHFCIILHTFLSWNTSKYLAPVFGTTLFTFKNFTFMFRISNISVWASHDLSKCASGASKLVPYIIYIINLVIIVIYLTISIATRRAFTQQRFVLSLIKNDPVLL